MTIEEILSLLTAGSMTELEAEQMLQAMMDAKASRADYAKAALTGLLSTGQRRSSLEDIVRDSFAYADLMVLAQDGKLPEPQPQQIPAHLLPGAWAPIRKEPYARK